MTYTVVWEHHAMTEFRRLRRSDSAGAKDCAAAVRLLSEDAHPPAARPLGGSGYHRLRAGQWRVLYRPDDATRTLHIVTAGRVP